MPNRTSVTLNYVEKGAGIPVLALHGWTPDHRLMLGCLEAVFARRIGYRRLYPDLPAMGRSPATRRPSRVPTTCSMPYRTSWTTTSAMHPSCSSVSPTAGIWPAR